VSWQKRIKAVFIALAVVALYLWTFLGIDIEWGRAIERISENFGVVIPKLFNPYWAVTREVTAKIMETIFISLDGPLMASFHVVLFMKLILKGSRLSNATAKTSVWSFQNCLIPIGQ